VFKIQCARTVYTSRRSCHAMTDRPMIAIFRRDGDRWQIVHVHNSISVPNEQIAGFEDFETGNAVQST